MTARIIPFPPRRSTAVLQFRLRSQVQQPAVIRILREDAAWLVTCRGQAWLHGSHDEALRDAFALAAEFNLPVTEAERTAQ
jgi:hypothetical protein